MPALNSGHGLTINRFDWAERAACKGQSLDMFFDANGGWNSKEDLAIRQFCYRCPVRLDCLEYAVANNCVGVWGGTTDNQRRVHSYRLAAQLDPTETDEAIVKRLNATGLTWREIRDSTGLKLRHIKRILGGRS